jgi:hypothetical protein
VETLVSRQRSTSDASSRLGSELIRRFLLEHAYVQALLKEVLIDSRSAWVSLLRDCARITSQIRLDRIVPAREYFAWSEAQ